MQKIQEKRQFLRATFRWECDIKMDFKIVVDLLASGEGTCSIELIKEEHLYMQLTAAQQIYPRDVRYSRKVILTYSGF